MKISSKVHYRTFPYSEFASTVPRKTWKKVKGSRYRLKDLKYGHGSALDGANVTGSLLGHRFFQSKGV
jgi:hypothetical protein